MKRTYRHTAIRRGEKGWQVELDGAAAHHPDGEPVRPVTKPLAEAMAEEWRSQGEAVRPATMPLTKLSRAVDRFPQEREACLSDLAGYAGTELLCYHDAADSSLREAQRTQWEPWLIRAERRYGVCFVRTEGVMPVPQPPETLQRMRRVTENLDPPALCMLWKLTRGLGSLILGLAVLEDAVSAERAVELSRLEAAHQEVRWGQDDESAAALERLLAETGAVERFLKLSRE